MARHSFPPVRLGDIAVDLAAQIDLIGDHATIASGITQDSRDVEPGDIYCCVKGATFDGHQYIAQAVERGAVAVVVDADVRDVPTSVAILKTPNVRAILGPLASRLMEHPSRTLRMIGVTGTNGKTSTVAILGSILRADGRSVREMGTLTGVRTTPEAIDLQAILADAVSDGITDVVMEVSSHALDQHRVAGIVFDAGVITNVTRDHLDYHGTEEAYFAAKAKLFEPGASRRGIVNMDDPRCQLLADVGAIPLETFGLRDASDIVVDVDHVEFTWRGSRISVPMGGQFTVLNALAAISAAESLGVRRSSIVAGCANITRVPGRFESVPTSSDVSVVVDYAHTPDGLRSLLTTARSLTSSDLIVVFGCGGNRDQGKRPLMGAVAGELADVVWVTSDNPRNEDPQTIIDEIVAGMAPTPRLHTEPDRGVAIASAISGARRGDIVVIAGKGHESTQETNGVHAPFSDVEVAKAALESREGKAL